MLTAMMTIMTMRTLTARTHSIGPVALHGIASTALPSPCFTTTSATMHVQAPSSMVQRSPSQSGGAPPLQWPSKADAHPNQEPCPLLVPGLSQSVRELCVTGRLDSVTHSEEHSSWLDSVTHSEEHSSLPRKGPGWRWLWQLMI